MLAFGTLVLNDLSKFSWTESIDNLCADNFFILHKFYFPKSCQVRGSQVRFQPTHGRFLAAVVGNGVSLINVETT